MNPSQIAGLVLAVFLMAYLLVAAMKPEWFS
jgi:K+-transporting ATPase KdpF subunit